MITAVIAADGWSINLRYPRIAIVISIPHMIADKKTPPRFADNLASAT